MKIIFLDHDGVICLSNNWGSRYKKAESFRSRTGVCAKLSDPEYGLPVNCKFDNFDKKSLKVLNSILEETNAEIVVSSDWKRHCTVEELGIYYEEQGIFKKPIAYTKKFSECDWHKSIDMIWSSSEELEQERFIEITQYIKDHPEITKWVAIDDLHMGKHVENSSYGEFDREWGLDNFVWTPICDEGIKQCGIKDKILKFLS